MPRDRLATAAILACMVAAVSTLPALLIAGSLPQPVVNNYYQTTNTTTNTTTPIMNTNGATRRRLFPQSRGIYRSLLCFD